MYDTKSEEFLPINTTIKLSILGQKAAGKSFLIYRFLDKDRNEEYVPTVEVKYTKTEMVDDVNTNFEILDTAGEEGYQHLFDKWVTGSDGVILVFAVNDREGFEKIKEKYKKILQLKPTPLVLIGNKIDLPNREVTTEEAKKIADEWNIKYYETSALKNTNCKDAFLEIAKVIVPKIKKATLNVSINSSSGKRCCKCIII